MIRALATTALGLLLCVWVVFGRLPFGYQGELTLTYGLVAIIPAALYLAAGHAWRLTAERGFKLRASTILMLASSWVCALLLGFMIPDIVPGGLATIVSGTAEPMLGIAIGIANPLAIIMVTTAAFAVGFAVSDSRGGPERYEDDDEYDGTMPAHPLAPLV